MKKTDARVRYTKNAIKEAFLACLEEKPVNRITVKEVCDRAQLNRATFYAHYRDCYDLLESLEGELLGEFEALLRYVDSPDLTALIEGIYALIDRNRDACRVLIFEKRSASLIRRMIEQAREKSLAVWRGQLPGIREDELEMLYTHLSHGLMHVVLDHYGSVGREDVIRFVNRIVEASLALYRGSVES